MTYTVTMVPQADVEDVIPYVITYLLDAVHASHGRTDIEHVIDDLTDARASLWLVCDADLIIQAAVITKVCRYPLKDMLLLELCGGVGMAAWIEKAVEVFRNFAIDSKLDGVEIYGRRGWARALRPYGMRETVVVTEIDLKQGSENVQ